METNDDEALIKQAKLEILVDMFEREIVGNVLYDNLCDLSEERKRY